MIDLNLIYTFLEVAKVKNLNLVAQKFSVSQPAISKRIQALEEQIGKNLFLRQEGMKLNSTGERFYKVCENYLKDITLIDNWIQCEKGYIGGTISITTMFGPVSYIFPNFLKRFSKKYKNVRFDCSSVKASFVVEDEVLSGKTDLGMMVGPPQKLILKTQTLFANNTLLMVCSPDYYLAQKKRITAKDLLEATLLLDAYKYSRTLRSIFKQLGFRYQESNNVLRLPDMESCKMHAIAGLGVGFIANIYIHEELKKGKLIALPGFQMKRAINLISRNEKYVSPAIKVFKKEFVKYCQECDIKWQYPRTYID